MTTTKLYPNLAADYRLEEVRAFRRELAGEMEKRKRLLDKNKRWRNILARSSEVLGVCTVGLGSASIGMLASGFGVPVAVPTAVTGALVGLIDLGIGPVHRRLEKKSRRHTRLFSLSESKLSILSRLLSKALVDGSLTDTEFQLFIDEKESWAASRDGINKTIERELQKLVSEFKARLNQIDKEGTYSRDEVRSHPAPSAPYS